MDGNDQCSGSGWSVWYAQGVVGIKGCAWISADLVDRRDNTNVS